ncbi:MAG TPA: SIR2 family protein, partial [Ktedonobacterales bacterium]|nr:SIR2 family protein [Ktedonobacterales bacterium]
MDIPPDLLEQVRRGNVVLFCGAGISVSQGGLPTGSQLAQELARRTGLDGLEGRPLPEVAEAYENRFTRRGLLEYLVQRINDPRFDPLPTHHLIAALPFKAVITTNWDTFLEDAFRKARRPLVRVVRDPEIAFADDSQPLLIKLHGSIDQPDTLVVTGDDYYDVFAHLPETANLVRAYFATRTMLFLGFSLTDDDFGRIYREVVRHLGQHQRQAYAVQLAPPSYIVDSWRRKNVQIFDSDAAAFLQALASQLNIALDTSHHENQPERKETPRRDEPARDEPALKTKEQWVEEGEAHRHAGRYQQALEACDHAISLDASFAWAYTGKGNVLWQLGRAEDALAAFEIATRLNSKDAIAFLGKGNALRKLKRHSEALTAYDHAIQL